MKNKYIAHFCTITRHKWLVFKLCCRAGIPWRGLVHDLSKYSPTEFIESAKFYQGVRSPIPVARDVQGYSKAWLHHKGRNKHHIEYWYDPEVPNKFPIIPYKYTVEMICDGLAAGIVYNGKNWTPSTQLRYWEYKKKTALANEKIKDLLTEVYTQVSKYGINKTINSKNLKKLYNQYCIEDNENKES